MKSRDFEYDDLPYFPSWLPIRVTGRTSYRLTKHGSHEAITDFRQWWLGPFPIHLRTARLLYRLTKPWRRQ